MPTKYFLCVLCACFVSVYVRFVPVCLCLCVFVRMHACVPCVTYARSMCIHAILQKICDWPSSRDHYEYVFMYLCVHYEHYEYVFMCAFVFKVWVSLSL
jgi:hypothetical protein